MAAGKLSPDNGNSLLLGPVNFQLQPEGVIHTGNDLLRCAENRHKPYVHMVSLLPFFALLCPDGEVGRLHTPGVINRNLRMAAQ